jgi:hypothetical protein
MLRISASMFGAQTSRIRAPTAMVVKERTRDASRHGLSCTLSSDMHVVVAYSSSCLPLANYSCCVTFLNPMELMDAILA